MAQPTKSTTLSSPRKPRPETLTLDAGGLYRLTRLSDSQYEHLRRSSIAIEEISAWFEHQLSRSLELSLGEFYASLKCIFGERGCGFDDWKGDFAFPLALEVPGAVRRPAYLLKVIDFRGSVEHLFRKLVDPDDPRLEDPIYYPPEPKELSLDQMEHFLSYFVGYQKGYYEELWRSRQEPFLLAVTSNHILYGFDGERFFEEQIESERRFERRRSALGKRLPTPGFYPGD